MSTLRGTPRVHQPARVELRLTIARGPADAPCDLLVDVESEASVASLADAIADELGRRSTGALWSVRSGALDPVAPVSQSDLRDGDVVSLGGPLDSAGAAGRPSHERGQARVELAVVSGPTAGQRAALAAGIHYVGRDPGADVSIDDPMLSRRHLTITIAGGSVTVADAGSRNGTAIDGTRLRDDEVRHVGEHDHVEIGNTLIALLPLESAPDGARPDSSGSVAINRPPRMARPYDPPQVKIDAPPQRPTTPRLPLAACIAPLLLGVAMFVIIKQPAMLLFSLLSPVMAVSTYVSNRRGGHRDYARALRAFRARTRELEPELGGLCRAELRVRRTAAPDAAELSRRAIGYLPELWERRRADADFLDLRLGIADQPTLLTVTFAEGGQAEERTGIERTIARHSTLAGAPVLARLPELGAIALSGDPALAEGLARWLVVQAATLHSPQDLVIMAALSQEREDAWRWLGWLPHLHSSGSPLEESHVAIGEAQSRPLLRALTTLIEERRAVDRDRFRAGGRHQFLLLLLDEDVAPSRATVEGLLADAPRLDMGVLWLGRERRDVPGYCGAVVGLDGRNETMTVSWPQSGRELKDATPDGIATTVADDVARALAPARDAGGDSRSAEIPRSMSLLDLLDLQDISAAAVCERWQRPHDHSLAAAVGHTGESPFVLDLRADGPHGVVAGTTGAGKSELLQSIVTSLALDHPPSRLSFLFVDYKGGAAFKDCVRLPHTAGMITDLDTHLTRRALLSLNAELRRREEILHDLGQKDLIAAEQNRGEQAPASLVIVIDEFATLKDEVPEFVDGVVDIARRGRSLGVHLILATQRPGGGVVSENIRANANLRIALRVANTSESEDVINDPGAARIPRSTPGRAFARTGHSELTEFQSAYVGASSAADSERPRVRVRRLSWGHAAGSSSSPDNETEGGQPTDLERCVAAAEQAAREAGIAPPPSPWLDPLPDLLSLEAVEGEPGDTRVLVLGLVDEPSRQRQRALDVDLEQVGHMLVYGASGAGKTMLLRTLAVSLARRTSPDRLHIYAMDFAGRGLAPLAALPHCGAVMGGDDVETVTRLFTLLRRAIDSRTQLFAEHGVTTLSEFERLTERVEPPARTVVLLDSYAGFTAAFERVNGGALLDALARVIADGRAVGVHVIATADRRGAVPFGVASLVPCKVVMRMASEDEYSAVGLDIRAIRGAAMPPGRAFVDGNREVQTALVGDSSAGDRITAAIALEAARMRELYGDATAPRIESMPTHHPLAMLPAAPEQARPYLGIDEIDLQPIGVDLTHESFLVAGPYRSGRTTALETLVRSLLTAPGAAELYLLAPRRSTLLELDCWVRCARGADACAELCAELLELVGGRVEEEPNAPLYVVIDDAGELSEGAVATALDGILRRGRDTDVRIIASAENGQARAFVPWIRELRKDGRGLLLEPDSDLDADILGVRLPRRAKAAFPPGRGFLVSDGQAVLVQVASAED